MAGMIGVPLMAVYVSSKLAVEGLTESMACELEPLGIRSRVFFLRLSPTTGFNVSTNNDLSVGDFAARH